MLRKALAVVALLMSALLLHAAAPHAGTPAAPAASARSFASSSGSGSGAFATPGPGSTPSGSSSFALSRYGPLLGSQPGSTPTFWSRSDDRPGTAADRSSSSSLSLFLSSSWSEDGPQVSAHPAGHHPSAVLRRHARGSGARIPGAGARALPATAPSDAPAGTPAQAARAADAIPGHGSAATPVHVLLQTFRC